MSAGNIHRPAELDPAHVAAVEEWRARRDQRLRAPDGWLSLAGLYWLEEGENRFRIVEGYERGEMLEVVRDEDGAPTMLYLASYPLTREPRAFA